MRIKLDFACSNLKLPINYQHLIQGLIYAVFDKDKQGLFLHDIGYKVDNKTFKMFVFSNLQGKYTVANNMITFENNMSFSVSSYSNEFIEAIYHFFCTNSKVILYNQMIIIQQISFYDFPYFKDEQTLLFHSISPIVAYTTEGKQVTYFNPSSSKFEKLCYKNIEEKNKALQNEISTISFSIKEVLLEKKRVVTFKNTFYIAYMTDLKIHGNYETLKLIYDTGLSSKGPAGFGMIELK